MRNFLPTYLAKAINFTWLLFLACTLSQTAQAEKPAITIYAIDLVNRMSEDGTTQYNALLNAFKDEGLKFNTIVRPLSRSQPSFKNDKSSCIFPATTNALITNDESFIKDQLISSTPIDRASLRLLTKSNRSPIQDLSELGGKKIAVINGLNPDIFFSNIDVTVEYSANEEARIRMLNADRIDAVLGFVPDALLAAEALDIPIPGFSKALSFISGEGVSIICHKTKSTQQFLSRTNKTIEKLKANGELRKILGPHADLVSIESQPN